MSRQFAQGVMVILLVGSRLLIAAESSDEAGEIAGPVKSPGGLCVVLGAGSVQRPDLVAVLAGRSAMLVHGLASDDAGLVRARAAIQKQNLAGQAMVEKIQLKRLPYFPDTINLLVVENPGALAAAGISREEMLRVVAPGGVLCSLEGLQWKRLIKSRPKEMDIWSHPAHGADGNAVSTDEVIKPPIGYRWADGLPRNINANRNCRGVLVDDERCYTLGHNEIENLIESEGKDGGASLPVYLTARDAFNGVPLWKVDCQYRSPATASGYRSMVAPFALDGQDVFAPKGRQVMAVEGRTGKQRGIYATEFPPVRLLVSDGVLVVAGWKDAPKGILGSDLFKLVSGAGSMEAFSAGDGKKLWSVPFAANKIVCRSGVVYGEVLKDPARTDRSVVAVSLKVGGILWRWPAEEDRSDWTINACGDGFVLVLEQKTKSLKALSGKDGSVLWGIDKGKPITPIVDGQVWCRERYEVKTGSVTKGRVPSGDGGCQPDVLVGKHFFANDKGIIGTMLTPYTGDANASVSYTGARSPCLVGLVVANGLAYVAQNGCICTPGHPAGFLAIGSSGSWPVARDFETARPVEQGPAWGTTDKETAGSEDWPTYRHDSERSAATGCELPSGVKELWRASLATQGSGMLGMAWRSRLMSCLSAPVVEKDRVFVAATDAGRVIALDASSGKQVWTAQLGSRVDSPPTLWRGLCLTACHDGWLYALSARTGELVWRTRVAPDERRMVAFGSVESLWPAIGAPVIDQDVAYVTAGRSSASDGGIALLAVDPATGKTKWGKQVFYNDRPNARQNDLLKLVGGKLVWHRIQFDPGNGKVAEGFVPDSLGGMLNGWSVGGMRMYGNRAETYSIGSIRSSNMAWDKSAILWKGGLLLASVAASAGGSTDKDYLWQCQLKKGEDRRIEALVLCANAAVLGGRTADAKSRKSGGWLDVSARKDGTVIAKFLFEAPLTFDGVAVANGRVLVSLQDGTLVCLGAE